jgi:hypothetical protein
MFHEEYGTKRGKAAKTIFLPVILSEAKNLDHSNRCQVMNTCSGY